jgi:4-carboxymuconolactone decarboxylase
MNRTKSEKLKMIRNASFLCFCSSLLLGGCAVSMEGQAAEKQLRFPQITADQLNAEQKPVAEEILKVSSSGLGGPYNSMLRSPVMAGRMLNMLDYVRFHTTVPRRLNEFAILIQARLWNSQVEWVAHYPLALKVGLSESVAADLNANRRPKSMKPDEAVVYDFSIELSTKHQISDATWKRASAIFSQQQIVDLIAAAGTYATTAMFLNASEQPTPKGTPSTVPPLKGAPPIQ